MQLPAIQYGDWASVKKRMNKAVAQLKRGADLVEVTTRDGMVETTEHPDCWLMMRQGSRGAEQHFYCFAPLRLAEDTLRAMRVDPTIPSPTENAVFAASLRTAWGILGLLSPDNQGWFIPRERHQPFLQAALEVWDELDAIGSRYYWALQGTRLWSHTTSLKYVLANMGVPSDVLSAPLPPEGPRGLLRYAHTHAQA